MKNTLSLRSQQSDRRTGEPRENDRRAGDDRRRTTEQRAVAIELGDTMLHMAVVIHRTSGEQIVSTSTTQWRHTAATLHDTQGEVELTSALKSFVTEQRLAGSQLLVALGSELCVTRAVAGASEDVVRELQELRERSRLYLTLGPGRKAIASSVSALDARHQHALLTVTSQNTLDTLARVADEVGLQLVGIESSQASLCRLLGSSPTHADEALLVIQLGRQQAHLAVMHQGRLLIDYRPGGRQASSHLGELIDQHHHRIVRYCQRYYRLPETALRRAVVVGGQVELGMALAKQPSISTVQLGPLDIDGIELPWQVVISGDQKPSPVALGLALRTVDSTRNSFPDLMESVMDVSTPLVWPALLKLLAPLAACLLAAVGLGAANWRLGSELEGMRSQLDATRPVVVRAERLRNELVAGRQEFTQLQLLATTMPKASWTRLVSGISGCLPSDLWLESLLIADMQQLTVKGASYTESGIYDFVSHLQHLPATDEVALLGTSSGQSRTGVVTSFDLDLKLKADGPLAASGVNTP